MEQVFADAIEHHHAGRLADAAILYRATIELAPRFADAHYNLGVLLCAQQAADQAEACFRSAIELRPNFPEAYLNLALACRESGKLDEAVGYFRAALHQRPDYLDALSLLGSLLRKCGRLAEATRCFRRMISLEGTRSAGYLNLADTLQEQGEREEAAELYQRVICLEPDNARALNNLGALLRDWGRLEEAASCYQRALALKPGFADAHSNLGMVFRDWGNLDEAVHCFRTAVEFAPDFPEAHYNLGLTYRELHSLDEAAACYRRAIEIRPDYAEAYNNLGVALQKQDKQGESIVVYRRAIELRADYPEAYSNLGGALHQQRQFEEAGYCCRKAIELRPDYAEAHVNLASTLLVRGRMAEGWSEYEWRWRTPENIRCRRDFAQPQWRGEAVGGRTLLVHSEQGYGDTLNFCRFIPMAASRGVRVILETPAALVRLVRTVPGIDLVVAHGGELPAFDEHCPMLSLPRTLGLTKGVMPDAGPKSGPYLFADDAGVAKWRERLALETRQRFRVGLVWAGSSVHKEDRKRSLDPGGLEDLVNQSGCEFFNLQKHKSSTPHALSLADVMDDVEDFADCAALIMNLDLVISVDTAVAHLAGALGKPVWLLDRFDHDWRWLAGRCDTPWYPTMRIFRQRERGKWGPVLAEVSRELSRLVGARGSSDPLPAAHHRL